jgi:ABC-2 type transport system ATP-binding protein
MNLMTGLIRPTCGTVSALGLTPDDPERYFRAVGYCTQFDSFPRFVTGRELIAFTLKLNGLSRPEIEKLTAEALDRVGMTEAADRKVAAYSKGMRQRIRLAQSICHKPSVLVLDEPLNGLDPMARAESMALFRRLAEEGLHVIISSHILHEVDQLSDRVILLSHGYVVAEGAIHGVREEVKEHPMQILVRCTNPSVLAARVFSEDSVVEAKIHDDGKGLMVRTRNASKFYLLLNQVVVDGAVNLESVAPADDDVMSVYQYLIGGEGGTA